MLNAYYIIALSGLCYLYRFLLRSDLPEHPPRPKAGLYSLPESVKHNILNHIYPVDIYPGVHWAELPRGRVHYWIFGPQNGKKVVLVSGYSAPAFIWRHVAPRIAESGCRVLVYDLYGRGYSDSPVSHYDLGLFTEQLALLMQYINWQSATLVGLSMGGAIVAGMVNQFPHLVDSQVVLIASTGLIETAPRGLNFRTSRLMRTLAEKTFVRRVRSTNFVLPVEETKKDALLVEIQSHYLPTFDSTLLLTQRYGPRRGQHQSFSSAHFAGRRVLLINGTKDAVVPLSHPQHIIKLLEPHTSAELVYIEGAGHELVVSHHEEVHC
ncbi:alpha/beta-hydrolase [Cylindrobasidium torrendii FP15055 ss-10]|uniref:Alpha/beta-hydrolase n=1 Tax=Cylindrobasidium torrendii FP15055 ss-10 TaxID=1314674 RepID=A0A0D7B8A6_9AGAR|nr:alpha/beta-hydrolase [Cylindrobasidium torrendii FP15055 ss-10]